MLRGQVDQNNSPQAKRVRVAILKPASPSERAGEPFCFLQAERPLKMAEANHAGACIDTDRDRQMSCPSLLAVAADPFITGLAIYFPGRRKGWCA